MKINGTWGGVCDDGFSMNEANVICRQLGMDHSISLGGAIVVSGLVHSGWKGGKYIFYQFLI